MRENKYIKKKNPIWFGNEQSLSIEARYLQTLDFDAILVKCGDFGLFCQKHSKRKAKKSLIYMKRKAEKNEGERQREMRVRGKRKKKGERKVL